MAKLKNNALHSSNKGFTIIELVIVFFFFALLSGLAVPNLIKAYSSWQRQLTVDDLLIKINSLSYFATKNGYYIAISKGTNHQNIPFEIPNGWSIQADNKIIYYPNGVCSGGILTLSNQQFKNKYELQAPYCTPHKL